jgi:hypothetical protein
VEGQQATFPLKIASSRVPAAIQGGQEAVYRGNPGPDQKTLSHYLESVRKAGLSECATDAELQKYSKMKHLALCDTKRAAN